MQSSLYHIFSVHIQIFIRHVLLYLESVAFTLWIESFSGIFDSRKMKNSKLKWCVIVSIANYPLKIKNKSWIECKYKLPNKCFMSHRICKEKYWIWKLMKKGKELVVCWFNIPGTCPLPDEFVLYCQHLYALVKRNEVKSPIMRILHVLLAYSHIIMVIPFPLVYYKCIHLTHKTLSHFRTISFSKTKVPWRL